MTSYLSRLAALAEGRHPATGETLTRDTILRVLRHPSVIDALLRAAQGELAAEGKQSILAALAAGRHPLTGEPLTEELALEALGHPAVILALERAAGRPRPDHQPPESKPGYQSVRLGLQVIIGLLFVWLSLLAWWGFQRFTHGPGTIFDPALSAGRNTILLPGEQQVSLELYKEFRVFVVAGAHKEPSRSMPDYFDSLIMRAPERLLPLVDPRFFALLELDASLAQLLRQEGFTHRMVAAALDESKGHCGDLGGWLWPMWASLDKELSSRVFRSAKSGGCGTVETLEPGDVAVVWAGSVEAVSDQAGLPEVAVGSRTDRGRPGEQWFNPGENADGTPVYLALGLGPGCTIFHDPFGSGQTHLIAPLDKQVDPARYRHWIALYHIGTVQSGRVQPLERPYLIRFVNGQGQVKPQPPFLLKPSDIGTGRDIII
jgi:hypothetical protein